MSQEATATATRTLTIMCDPETEEVCHEVLREVVDPFTNELRRNPHMNKLLWVTEAMKDRPRGYFRVALEQAVLLGERDLEETLNLYVATMLYDGNKADLAKIYDLGPASDIVVRRPETITLH